MGSVEAMHYGRIVPNFEWLAGYCQLESYLPSSEGDSAIVQSMNGKSKAYTCSITHRTSQHRGTLMIC